jgi:hypothetical protein
MRLDPITRKPVNHNSKPLTLSHERRKVMKTRIFITGLLFAAVFAFSSAIAQVPQKINYQGKLTTPGTCALDTTISMTFKIYADSTTPTSLWSETQSSVTVEEGIFNVLLGNVSSIPTSVFNGSTRYLGVKVGGDSEMSPRTPMVSVGYAYTAGNADKVDGYHAGNTSGQVAVSNGTKCTNLNADKVDGYNAGNSSGQVAVSNGTKCTNLNADKVDGYNAGNSSGQVAVSNGTKCSNLNADKVDGIHVLVKDIFTAGSNDYFVNNSWVKIYGYGTSYRLKIENPSGSGTSIRYVYSLDFATPTMGVLSAGQNVTFSYSGKSSIEIRVIRHNITADYQVTLHGVNGYNGWVHANVIYND